MSRNAAAVAPGRTNRRFVMLAIVLGLLGAIMVYAVASRGGSSGGAGGGNTPVVIAKGDIPARTRITQSMVEVRLVPAGDASSLAYADAAQVVGQVTRFPISANEQLLTSKVVPLDPGLPSASRALSYTVPAGKRGLAINISVVQSAGGLVLPGDYVDLVVVYDVKFNTKAGDPSAKETEASFVVQTLLQNVEVLAVSQTVVDAVPSTDPNSTAQVARNSEAKPNPEAITVTLALSPEDVQRVYLAESNGKIRLSVRPYGDADQKPVDQLTKLDLLPQNLPNPFTR